MKVVIVGAGFGGIGAGIELSKHGFGDVTILDRAPEIGGTWHYNTYPGAACDVPSHLYSFSFAQRRHWTRLCSPQDEILRYLKEVAAEFGMDRRVIPGVEVNRCRWDPTATEWTVEAADGRAWTADAVILATGQLHQAAYPAIEGRDRFAGHSFHSSRWDHGYDFGGKRVAVIGTGASAVQFVPEIARRADELLVFQRTANWFLPRNHEPYSGPHLALIKHVPGVQALRRRFLYHYGELLTAMIRHPRTLGRLGHAMSSSFMRRQLPDPELRRRLWPEYTFGCKRVLFSSEYLPALARDNVTVFTDPVVAMTEHAVVAGDGTAHEVDCVIYATGFRTNDFMLPMEVIGAEGQTIAEAWAGGPHAHLGVTVPGFPSLFLMYGPNTNTSGGSIIVYEEAQAGYIRQALEYARTARTAIDVRVDVEQASDRRTQDRFAGTAWTECDSWYRNQEGRIVANWPGYMREYEKRLRTFDPSEFDVVAARTPQVA